MKKSSKEHILNLQEWLKRSLVPLLLSTVFMVTSIIQTQALSKNQEEKITFPKQQLSVEQVFDVITKQLRYDVFYSENELHAKRLVQLPHLTMALTEVLDFVLENKFTYTITGKTIVIRPVVEKQVAKERKITGFVQDETQNPLPGVSILIKGTTIGVSSDVNGRFQLVIPASIENPYLVFTFVGMETIVQPVTKDTVNVTMKMDVQQMEEVVVRTGYENIDKRKLTSSVVTVKMEDIIEPLTMSLDKMLQGKIPGMAVLQQSSTIGAAPKIRIRGSSSIMGSREPLWVLDGIVLEDPVPLDPSDLNSMDKVNLIGNAISGLNPEDIEQIDVLKDASATALYGSKAANGVIMITTKRGKYGKPAIRYNLSMGFTHRPTVNQMHLMNSKERIEVSEEMVERGLYFMNIQPISVGYEALLVKVFNNEISYQEFLQEVKKLKEQNTDWYKLLFRNAFSHQHTLSVSGANDGINYYFSIGYNKEKGTTLQEAAERFNFNTNLDIKISPQLNASFGLSASNGTTERPVPGLYEYAYTTSRAVSPYDENGNYLFYDQEEGYNNDPYRTPNLVYNIFNELDNTGSESSLFTLNTRLNLGYKINSAFNVNALLAYNVSSNKSETWATEKSYQISSLRRLVYGYPLIDPKDDANFGRTCKLPFGGQLDMSDNKNVSFSGRVSASFQKTFNEVHDLSAMVGWEARSSHATGHTSTVLGYLPERGKKHVDINPTVWTGYADLLKSSQPTITDRKENEVSYFATLSYCYDRRYIINTNVRGDANNKLGQDKSARFLPIWSVSGRWNISDEYFMLDVNWIQGLNIHASYGLQGNVTEAHNPNMVADLGSKDDISQFYESTLYSLPNNGLRWEKTRSFNIGTDFSLFKGRFNAMFEYYNKKGKDQLVSTSIESTNGATSVTINDGDVTNSGWEFSFSATPIQTNNVSWNLSLNTSQNYNKVTNSGEMDQLVVSKYLDGTLVKNGRSLNSFYSYRYGGLDENGRPTFLGVKAKDDEGNVLISSREEAIAQALVYSGRREPLVSGGFSTSVRVYNFTLNASFSMQFGSKMRLNDLYSEDARLPMPSGNMSDEFVDRWRKPGDEKYTDIPVLSDESTTVGGIFFEGGSTAVIDNNIYKLYNDSDLRVVSGNFVRCRNISLAYYFNQRFLQKLYMKGASLSFSIANPFVIKAKGLKGRDPEQVEFSSNTIPPQKNLSFSLSVTF